MTTPKSDNQLIEKLILGQLPVAEAERLAVEYADDSRVAEVAESVSDTLVDSLRNHETTDDSQNVGLVDRMVQRLKSLAEPSNLFDDTVGVEADGSHSQERIPERLEYFRIIKVLGQGGMGTVCLADDTRLGRQVALKTLKRELAANPAAKDRFLREARTAARLDHDHIIPIYYVGESEGIPFLAMPFLQGEPLDQRIKREKSLPIPVAIKIARQVAVGLSAAHSRNLIHRDIKPANIWLESSGEPGASATGGFRVKILDFGLARSRHEAAHLTASGAIIGTPAYMAPEQARGKPVDARADLFSLGSVLYEMITGKRPFQGSDTMATLTSLALDVPPDPNTLNAHCPLELSQLTMQLLAKLPEQRPATADVVAKRLAKLETPVVTPLESATAVDPWSRIDDSDTTEHLAVNNKVVGTLRVPTESPRKRRVLPYLAIGLLFAFIGIGILFGGTVIRVVNNEGELVVTVDDPNTEVVVKGEGVEIRREENGKKRVFLVKAGKDGEVEVREPGSDTVLVMEKFKVTRAGKVEVLVTAEKLAAARKVGPMAGDPNRRAAEYVLSIGGTVGVNGEARVRKTAAELPKEPFQLTNMYLLDNQLVNDAGLANFKACKNLMSIGLNNTKVTDTGLAHFQDCKKLTHLDLTNTKVGDAGMVHFKDCKDLAFLELAATQVSDTGLAHFKNCKNLTYLQLSGTQVGDAGLAYFEGCKHLTYLHLGATKVSDAGLAHFKDCKLTQLNLAVTQVSDAGLVCFQNSKNLTNLNLGSTKVSDAGLAHFKDCTTLTWLSLGDTRVSEAGLAHFKNSKNLTYFNLNNTVVGDTGLAHIKDFKNLTFLILRRTKVTAAGIEGLKKALPQCKIEWDGGVIEPKSPDRKVAEYVLSIGGNVRLTANGKEGNPKLVSELPQGPFELRIVDLVQNGKVNDAGLAVFKDCKELTHLFIHATPIGDAGLAHLKSCTNLTTLTLQKTKVTAQGVDDFKKALPNCKVEWDGGAIEPKGK